MRSRSPASCAGLLRALAGGALGLATLAVVAGALRAGGWRRAAIGHHEYRVAAKVDDV